MKGERSLILAIDFDGTIVEDRYPAIGKPMPFAFDTLKKLESDGHRLILWTYRTGKKLEEAVEFCRQNDLEFYAVNRSFPEEDALDPVNGRKIHADLFIDDRNFGGFPGWGVIYQQLTGSFQPPHQQIKRRKFFGLFKR